MRRGSGEVRAVGWLSQHFDEQTWEDDGFSSAADSKAWSERSCGLACLRMVLTTHGLAAPEQAGLLHQARSIGGFTDRGLVHEVLVELARTHGLAGEACELKDAERLDERMRDGASAIVSITCGFPADGRRGGHLAVYCGRAYSPDQEPMVLVRDPSRWGRINSHVIQSRFHASYSGRAILLWPPDSRE